MILVTFAVPFESAAFRRHPASRSVRILHTGVGADAARVAVEAALCREPSLPERVISAGFAGGLGPGLAVGSPIRSESHRLLTVDRVIASASEKSALYARTGADAVDMETEAIAEVCSATGVPMTFLRVISDGASEDLGVAPDLLAGLARAPWQHGPALGWALVTNPGRRRAFLRFVANCRVAQLALARALVAEVSAAGGGI